MKVDVTQLQYLMDRSNFCKDNTHTKKWCSDNIDYKIEHVMNKCLDLYLQLLHGEEIQGSSTCSFQILTNMKN